MSDLAPFLESVLRHDQISGDTALSRELEECRRLRALGRERRCVSVVSLGRQETVYAQGQFDEDGEEWKQEALDDDDSDLTSIFWQVSLTSTKPGGWKASDMFNDSHENLLKVCIGKNIKFNAWLRTRSNRDTRRGDDALCHDPQTMPYDQDEQSTEVPFEVYSPPKRYINPFGDDQDEADRARLVALLAPVTEEQHRELLHGNLTSLVGNATINVTFLRVEFPLGDSGGWNADIFRFGRPSTLLLELHAQTEGRLLKQQLAQVLQSTRKSCDISDVTRLDSTAPLEIFREVAEIFLSKTMSDLKEENERLQALLLETNEISIGRSHPGEIVVHANAKLDSGIYLRRLRRHYLARPVDYQLQVVEEPWRYANTRVISFYEVPLKSETAVNVETLSSISIRLGEFIVLSLAEATKVHCVEQHDSHNKSTLLRFTGFGGDDANSIALFGRIGPITEAQNEALYHAKCTNDIQDMFENGDEVRIEFVLLHSAQSEGALRIWRGE